MDLHTILHGPSLEDERAKNTLDKQSLMLSAQSIEWLKHPCTIKLLEVLQSRYTTILDNTLAGTDISTEVALRNKLTEAKTLNKVIQYVNAQTYSLES